MNITYVADDLSDTDILVNRIHAVYDWRHPLDASLSVVLMEFGDFAMNRQMMRGVKTRAESLVREREG